jgi:formate hydrogenlyase subunit 4
MTALSLLPPLGALLLAPLLPGIITRTRCWLTGRRGPPLLQTYADLLKLLAKGAVYSSTTTAVFRAGPLVGLAAVAMAAVIVPFGAVPALLAFPGDLILLCGLLALMRFVTVLAALDTGSAFEGMGASREVQFAALAEPALVLALAVVVRSTGNLSLSGAFAALTPAAWAHEGAALVLVFGTLFVVYLTENARVPVDDPGTHLELTMIHEVMVLDHGGPDLGLIHYAAALKLWVLGALLVGVALPVQGLVPWAGMVVALAGMLVLAVLVGVVETVMARLKLVRVPQLLVGATALAVLAMVLVLRG